VRDHRDLERAGTHTTVTAPSGRPWCAGPRAPSTSFAVTASWNATQRRRYGLRSARLAAHDRHPDSRDVEEVAELLAFVSGTDVVRRRLGLERDALDDRQAVPLEARSLVRVVREQPHRPDAEIRRIWAPIP
jgi:hypothetical protein